MKYFLSIILIACSGVCASDQKKIDEESSIHYIKQHTLYKTYVDQLKRTGRSSLKREWLLYNIEEPKTIHVRAALACIERILNDPEYAHYK